MPDSVFNANVTGWSVSPQSSTFVNDFVTDYKDDFGSVGVNTAPIYAVPAGTPLSTVSVSSGCNNFLSSTGNEVPVPAFTNLNGSSDNPLILYSVSLNKVWEFWQMRSNGSGYSACWGGSAPLSTFSGVFPAPFGLSATGISYAATTITENDILSGSIDHAIAFILPCHSAGGAGTYVYPADRSDCDSTSGQPSEGQWFRFAPGTPMPGGLTPFGQMVFRAVQTYGMVVVDQGGAVMLEAEQSSDWAAQGHSGTDPISQSWDGAQEYQVVANLPWGSLQALNAPQSAVVLQYPLPRPFYPWPAQKGK
jgi:hypothetical protein